MIQSSFICSFRTEVQGPAQFQIRHQAFNREKKNNRFSPSSKKPNKSKVGKELQNHKNNFAKCREREIQADTVLLRGK